MVVRNVYHPTFVINLLTKNGMYLDAKMYPQCKCPLSKCPQIFNEIFIHL